MATAVLTNGRRLNFKLGGVRRVFENGNPETITVAEAQEIRRGNHKNRIDIEFTDEELAQPVAAAPAEPEKKGPPTDQKVRHRLILEAIDQMDIDDEKLWTSAGKPDARYLTQMLGWQVTAAERDDAMTSKGPGKVRIIRKDHQQPEQQPQQPHLEAVEDAEEDEGDKVEPDPSTEGAVNT